MYTVYKHVEHIALYPALFVFLTSVFLLSLSISVPILSAIAAILSATAATASLYTPYVYLSTFLISDMH